MKNVLLCILLMVICTGCTVQVRENAEKLEREIKISEREVNYGTY